METNNKPNRLHPLVAIAAVSVTVLSLAGVAAITGLLPTSHSENGPVNTPVATLAAPAAHAQSSDHESTVAAAIGQGRGSAQDLRMPDTRDLASGRGTSSAPDVLVVKVAEPTPQSDGVDWAEVGIGAGAVGIAIFSIGGAVLVAQRRRRVFPAH